VNKTDLINYVESSMSKYDLLCSFPDFPVTYVACNQMHEYVGPIVNMHSLHKARLIAISLFISNSAMVSLNGLLVLTA
jgi:hypothetical protein